MSTPWSPYSNTLQSGTPVTLVDVGDPGTLIINNDPINYLYLFGTTGANVSGTQFGVIPPGGSVVADGSERVYGAPAAGKSVQVITLPGMSQYSALPLVSVPIYNIPSTTLALSQTINPVSLNPVTILGAGLNAVPIAGNTSYELQMSATGVTLGTGLIQVRLRWFTNLTDTNPTDEVDFIIKAPLNTGAILITGHGPNRGLYLAITLTNLDSNRTVTLNNLTISGSSRNYTCDDWRSNAGLSLPYGNASPIAYSNELCLINAESIPASTTIQASIILYSGRVLFYADAGATGTLTFQIVDWNANIIASLHPGQSAQIQQEMILPRGQCTLNVANSSASAAGTCDVAIIADRV